MRNTHKIIKKHNTEEEQKSIATNDIKTKECRTYIHVYVDGDYVCEWIYTVVRGPVCVACILQSQND